MAENNNDLGASFMDNFSCKICLEILHDPVQCRNNEHYFCRKCITKHLMENSETCPLCMDQLTLETLRPPTRIILDIISQMRRPRCRHVARGCTENIAVAEVLLHQETCGFAPVVCSNEGCKETVNRRDKESHETEECKFRKITCEYCSEEMVCGEYEKHQCTLRREMDEMKSRLDEMNDTLKKVVVTQGELLEKLTAHDKSIKDIQNPLHHISSATIQRGSTVINGQIFIFSGTSLEVFNWSTKTWTLVQNSLFFQRINSFSFLYGKKIMVCGSDYTERIEYLNPSEGGYSATMASVSLPSHARYNGVLYDNKILTFGKGVVETSLQSPGESKTVIEEERHRNRSAGVHCFGGNIYIVGGQNGSMEKYDVLKNELQTLPALPFKVSDMATVAYKDNIIILGGKESQYQPLNDVVMFNVTSQEYTKLPSMLKRRSGCTAVIMGDVIVVMGGCYHYNMRGHTPIPQRTNTVEYYVIGHETWQELPAMNVAKSDATACVYV